MRLKDIGEDPFIEGLAARFRTTDPRVLKAIGDDTAVAEQDPERLLLATTDTMVEGTHFRLDYTPPRLLGRKALSISISDVAAMGGVPFFYLVSLTAPPSTEVKFLDELYRGLKDVGRRWGAQLAGGNTTRSGRGITVTTTLVGEAPRGEVVYRAGARPGDIVYVTGTTGDSALGHKALSETGPGALEGPYKKAVKRHLDPTPRLKLGRLLASEGLATAMIDISDGVLIDLGRLCSESSTGAVVESARLRRSKELARYGKEAGERAALKLALTGGEDYELLFTSPPDASVRIKEAGKKLRLPVTPVGRVVPRAGGVVALGPDSRPMRLTRTGFTHF